MKRKLAEKALILDKLKALKTEIKERYKVKTIGLFGSIARGDSKKSSDIDVLIEFDSNADFLDRIGLELFLEDHLARKVDIVSKRLLKGDTERRVLSEVAYV